MRRLGEQEFGAVHNNLPTVIMSNWMEREFAQYQLPVVRVCSPNSPEALLDKLIYTTLGAMR